MYLRQSTAVDLAIGPFVDDADGVTALTGLTIAQADVRLKKNNAAWAQINDATSATHEENGWYEKEFDATDTNTVGRLLVAVHEAGALPVWHEFWVLEEAVYDALFAASATGLLPANVTQWNGAAVATPTVAGVPEVDVTHWIGTAAATPTTAGVPEVDVTFWLGSAAQGASGRPQVDVELWLGSAPNALASGRVDATVGAMQANVMTAAAAAADLTTELQSGLSTLDAAGVRTAVGLASANLDTQLAALPTAAENADAVWEEAIVDHSGTVGSTAEQLAAAGAAGDPWATALPGAYGAGTAGKIVGDNLNATVSSRATQTSVDTIDGIVDDILLDTAEIGTAGAGLTNINLPDQTMNITGNITGNLSGSVGSVTGAVGSVTGNVGGNVVGSVASVTAEVSANVTKINNVAVTGTGVLGDEWGP
jgi:hypothetical protein